MRRKTEFNDIEAMYKYMKESNKIWYKLSKDTNQTGDKYSISYIDLALMEILKVPLKSPCDMNNIKEDFFYVPEHSTLGYGVKYRNSLEQLMSVCSFIKKEIQELLKKSELRKKADLDLVHLTYGSLPIYSIKSTVSSYTYYENKINENSGTLVSVPFIVISDIKKEHDNLYGRDYVGRFMSDNIADNIIEKENRIYKMFQDHFKGSDFSINISYYDPIDVFISDDLENGKIGITIEERIGVIAVEGKTIEERIGVIAVEGKTI